MLDIPLRIFVLLTAAVQITFPFFVNPFRDGAQPVNAGVPSQIVPAGYAFSIWGAIYLAALVYAVWQLTAPGRRDPVTLRIGPLAIVINAGSSLWLAAAQYGPLWATMPILAVMALCAVTALVLATHGGDLSLQRSLCLVLPFGLYAGWTVCATFVNVAEVAPAYGFARFGLSVPAYAVLSIGVLTTVAAVISWLTRANLAFAATVAWALVAIIVAARQKGFEPSVVMAAGAALVAVVALTVLSRMLRRGTDGRSSRSAGAARS